MIKVDSRAFVRAAKVATSCIERSTVPILEQLHVHANGALALSATDMDMTVETRIDYDGRPQAPFMLGHVREILAAIGHVGGAQIGLEPGEDTALKVTGQDLAIDVRDCQVVDDWPVMNDMSEPMLSGTLGQRELRLVRRVARAMSAEETRYYLNGLFVHQLDAWTLRCVATDGHRLTCADLKMPDMMGDLNGLGSHPKSEGVIIPRKMINLMLAQLCKTDDVHLGIGRAVAHNADADVAPDKAGRPIVDLIGMQADVRVRMLSKTIDGTFPDYARVVPTTNDKRVAVKAAALRRAINALASLSDSELTPAIKLGVVNDTLSVSVNYPSAHASMTVPCVATGADGFSIGFNGRYLLDILRDLPGEDVVFELADAAAPTIIRDPSESDIFSVLMPMRL